MQPIKGMNLATTNSGIKYKNRDDLLLITFDKEVNVAGIFAKSSLRSKTIDFCQNSLKNGQAKSLIVNAGNANTFTGQDGQKIIDETAKAISENLPCDKNDIFISSTGVIGEIFDYNLITGKISNLIQNLNNDQQSWINASKAILTTDLKTKSASSTLR